MYPVEGCALRVLNAAEAYENLHVAIDNRALESEREAALKALAQQISDDETFVEVREWCDDFEPFSQMNLALVPQEGRIGELLKVLKLAARS